jgi:hypothetical protein
MEICLREATLDKFTWRYPRSCWKPIPIGPGALVLADLLPVRQTWEGNCNVRRVMGMCCEFGCATAMEKLPPEGNWWISQLCIEACHTPEIYKGCEPLEDIHVVLSMEKLSTL